MPSFVKKKSNHEVLSTSAQVIRWTCSILLILYSCITIFVLAVTLMDSLKTQTDLATNFVGLPAAISFENYVKVLMQSDFLLYFRNSVILTFCGTCGCILLLQ